MASTPTYKNKTNVSTFAKLGTTIEGIVKEDVARFVETVWDELVMTPVHPRDTGTLQHSWKVVPYTGNGTYLAYYPPVDEYPRPAPLDLTKYKRQWSNFVLYNNQPYLMRVNDLQGKPYSNWIEIGFAKAVAKFK